MDCKGILILVLFVCVGVLGGVVWFVEGIVVVLIVLLFLVGVLLNVVLIFDEFVFFVFLFEFVGEGEFGCINVLY